MPKVIRATEVEDTLKPYVFHGIQVECSGDEAMGDCPFCGREGKFSINVASGQWRCVICAEDGNSFTFLRKLHTMSIRSTKEEDWETLAANRGLEFGSLQDWGLALNPLNKRWLIPGYTPDHHGKLQLTQLYAYSRVKGRMILLPTPGGFKHALLGLHLYAPDKEEVYVAEGIWDGIRLYEVMASIKQGTDGNLSATNSSEHCFLLGINVVAAPSCSTFSDTWTKWFKDKDVFFAFDNDHSKTHPTTGEQLLPAAYEGTKRATAKITHVARSISFLKWGEEGFDPKLPDGYDLRDALKNKVNGLTLLFNRTEPVPEEWLEPSAISELQCRTCTQYSQLINAWRKALKWTDGLEHALVCMLASVASTKSIGDQLWMKIIGPASCGKSTLCEALSVNKKYTLPKSTIRGFHSGYRESNDTKEDNSLVAQVNGKTLITKDGDTLLQSPNLSQILSEGRDLYDSVSRTHYRNKASKDYEGIRMTWLLCGTSSLRAIDSSELGERFLDCVIMESIDIELEDEILWRVAHRAAEHVNLESNGESVSQYSPEMLEAMQLTGGYVSWLRENAAKELPKITFADDAKQFCIHIGKFVAYLRARPSKQQAERAERELAARLVSQHIRLAKCAAFVTNKPAVDETVMARVKRVGLDTSRGAVLEIVQQIYTGNNVGVSTNGLRLFVDLNDADLKRLLKFCYRIGVLRHIKKTVGNVWQLTEPVFNLCKEML